VSDENLSPELQAYILRAVQLELTDLRKELHNDYLNDAQMKLAFVTREELRERAMVRREWPVILATVALALTSIANVVVVVVK
jgi:hypothetical protein